MVTVPKGADKLVVGGQKPGAKATANPADNRKAQRHPFVAAAEIIEVASRVRMNGRTSDIGLDGCYIDTLSPLPAGSAIIVRIEKDRQHFQAAGKIVYALSGMGLGVSFSSMEPNDDALLHSWIDGLNGGRLPDLETNAGQPSLQTATVPQANSGFVLHELIRLLVRRRLIDESDAATLLRQMFR